MRKILSCEIARNMKSSRFLGGFLGIIACEEMDILYHLFLKDLPSDSMTFMVTARNGGFVTVSFLMLTFYALLAGASYKEDSDSHYSQSVISRCGWKRYAAGKAIGCVLVTYIGVMAAHAIAVFLPVCFGVQLYNSLDGLYSWENGFPREVEAVCYIFHMNHIRAMLGVVLAMVVLAASAWVKSTYILVSLPTVVYMLLFSMGYLEPFQDGLAFSGIYGIPDTSGPDQVGMLFCVNLLCTLFAALVCGGLFYCRLSRIHKRV